MLFNPKIEILATTPPVISMFFGSG
jgi:hypothetical protein